MRAVIGVLLTGALLSVPLPARAGETVHFTNGTYMHVMSHEVQGDMVRVRLDGDAALAFPSKLIEKIESGAGVVYSSRTSLQANQAAPRPVGAANENSPYPVGVNPALANRASTPTEGTPQRQPFVPGAAMSGQESNGKYLDGSILGSKRPGPDGTTMVGNKLVIDGGKSPGRFGFVPQPFQAKPGVAQPTPTPPASPFPPPGSAFPNRGTVQQPSDGKQPVDEPAPDQPESEGGP